LYNYVNGVIRKLKLIYKPFEPIKLGRMEIRMKRIISFVTVIAMLLSCMAFTVPVSARAIADDIDYVDALYFENAPTVDGYISDAEWGEYSVFVEALDCATIDDNSPYSRFFYNRVSATNMDDYVNFSYYVWLRWSEQYFYIGVKVNDANVHSLKNGTTNTWNGDAVHTRIDKAGANAAVNGGNFTVTADRTKPWSTNLVPDFLFGYSEIAGGFSEAWENNSNKGMTSFSNNPLGTAPCVVAPAGSNYSSDTQNGITTYEVAIPWAYILNGDFDTLTYTEYKTGRNGNLQGGIGREFGMSLAVLDDGNDAVAGWDAYMSWGSGICETHQTEGAHSASGSNAVTLVATPVSQQAGYRTYDPTPLLDAKFSDENIDPPEVYYDYLAGDLNRDNKLHSRDELSTLTYDDPADLSVWGAPEYFGVITNFGGDHGNVLDYTDTTRENGTTYIDTRDGDISYLFPTSYTFEFDIKYTDTPVVIEGYESAIYNWFGGASVYAYQCGYFFNDSMFKVVNTNNPLDVLAQYPYELKQDNWYNWKFQFDNESCTARLWIDDLTTQEDNVMAGEYGSPGYTCEWGTLVINTNWRYFYYSSENELENGTLLLFRQMNTAVAYDNVRIYSFASPVECYHFNTVPQHKDPTCTEEGYDREYCYDCESPINVKKIPALGHTVVIEHKDATLTEEGYHKEYCSVCSEILADDVLEKLKVTVTVNYRVADGIILETVTFENVAPDGFVDIELKEYKGCTLVEDDDYTEGVYRVGPFSEEALTVDILYTREIAFGDVNGDGTVSAKDSAILKSYLAGQGTDVNEIGADINMDDAVDVKDANLLKRILTGTYAPA